MGGEQYATAAGQLGLWVARCPTGSGRLPGRICGHGRPAGRGSCDGPRRIGRRRSEVSRRCRVDRRPAHRIRGRSGTAGHQQRQATHQQTAGSPRGTVGPWAMVQPRRHRDQGPSLRSSAPTTLERGHRIVAGSSQSVAVAADLAPSRTGSRSQRTPMRVCRHNVVVERGTRSTVAALVSSSRVHPTPCHPPGSADPDSDPRCGSCRRPLVADARATPRHPLGRRGGTLRRVAQPSNGR